MKEEISKDLLYRKLMFSKNEYSTDIDLFYLVLKYVIKVTDKTSMLLNLEALRPLMDRFLFDDIESINLYNAMYDTSDIMEIFNRLLNISGEEIKLFDIIIKLKTKRLRDGNVIFNIMDILKFNLDFEEFSNSPYYLRLRYNKNINEFNSKDIFYTISLTLDKDITKNVSHFNDEEFKDSLYNDLLNFKKLTTLN